MYTNGLDYFIHKMTNCFVSLDKWFIMNKVCLDTQLHFYLGDTKAKPGRNDASKLY